MSLALVSRLRAQNTELSVSHFMEPTDLAYLCLSIRLITTEIKAGERIGVKVPRSLSHTAEGELDLDFLDDVQTTVRGDLLRSNVFATLRFGNEKTRDVSVDICAFSEIPEGPQVLVEQPVAPAHVQSIRLDEDDILEIARTQRSRARDSSLSSHQVLGQVKDTTFSNPDSTAVIPLTPADVQYVSSIGTNIYLSAVPKEQAKDQS